jgi:hypothetical protein
MGTARVETARNSQAKGEKEAEIRPARADLPTSISKKGAAATHHRDRDREVFNRVTETVKCNGEIGIEIVTEIEIMINIDLVICGCKSRGLAAWVSGDWKDLFRSGENRCGFKGGAKLTLLQGS